MARLNGCSACGKGACAWNSNSSVLGDWQLEQGGILCGSAQVACVWTIVTERGFHQFKAQLGRFYGDIHDAEKERGDRRPSVFVQQYRRFRKIALGGPHMLFHRLVLGANEEHLRIQAQCIDGRTEFSGGTAERHGHAMLIRLKTTEIVCRALEANAVSNRTVSVRKGRSNLLSSMVMLAAPFGLKSSPAMSAGQAAIPEVRPGPRRVRFSRRRGVATFGAFQAVCLFDQFAALGVATPRFFVGPTSCHGGVSSNRRDGWKLQSGVVALKVHRFAEPALMRLLEWQIDQELERSEHSEPNGGSDVGRRR